MRKLYYQIKLWLDIKTNLVNLSYAEFKETEYKAGYVSKDGEPLVCYNCGNKSFMIDNTYQEGDWGLVEYSKYCDQCLKKVGHWAYGNWS